MKKWPILLLALALVVAVAHESQSQGATVRSYLYGIVDEVSPASSPEGSTRMIRTTPTGEVYTASSGGGGGTTGDVNLTQIKGSAVDTNTGAASAATLRMVPATGSTVAATQSGVFTVQPGNTANTTPWLQSLDQTGNHNDVDVATFPANTPFNLAQIAGTAPDIGDGGAGSATIRVDIAAAAHGATDTGRPIKIGGRAIAHGANPTAVAAGQRTDSLFNRDGMQFISCGHPNTLSREVVVPAGSAQTNIKIVTVSAGTIIVVTQVQGEISADVAGVVTSLRLGLAQSALPSASTTGAAGILFSVFQNNIISSGLPEVPLSRGDGCGILGIGADGDDLIYTASNPTGGQIAFVVSYYTIES